MKSLSVLVVTCGLMLTAWAENSSENTLRNRYWLDDVTLTGGLYQGDSKKPIEVEKGKKVVTTDGCAFEGTHFKGFRDGKWDASDSFFRNSRVEMELSGRFTATNCAFENVELNKTGGWFVDHWSTRWKFENCVFAGKFSPSAMGVTDYAFHASHCTFNDIDLPAIRYKKDPAEEAQSNNLNFTACRFYRCTVPESFLATTTDCVFEECRFPGKREAWEKATKPILVTAYIVGRAAPPQSYENGNLKVTFKGAPTPESGATVKYSYTDRHLALSKVPTRGVWTAIGIIDNKPTGNETPAPAKSSPVTVTPAPPRPEMSPDTQAATAELVKSYRNSLVFVTGANGAGSGFLAKYATGSFLFTNAHVAAGVRGAAFKTLDGTEVKVGAASSAVGHDVFLMQATSNGLPFEIMKDVDQNAAIGDEIVVLGNAEGAGVINTITGKIVGLGPQLVEVDAPFQPGNSGSPIVHLKTGKVIGLATYAIIRKYDPSTKQPIKDPVIRRFGYRLDSIKTWQPVNWQAFFAQAVEMEAIEKLTKDLAAFLDDLASEKGLHLGAHNNPAIKNRIDAWLEARSKKLSPRDASMADQGLISFLKVACQSDVTAARQHITYDYFQRDLADQQRERDEISGVFNEIIQNLRK